MRNGLCAAAVVFVVSSAVAAAVQPPAEGSHAPAFSLPSQEGSAVSLDQQKGKWVVLYFYPKDFTGGCTLEAHNFQRDIAQYQKLNAVVLGVSLDTVDSHKSFCEKEGLSFKLLADTDHKVAEAYGSLMDAQGQNFAARNTFLIDPSGVVRKVYLKVKPAQHSAQVLTALGALQAQTK